jgi:hypothetical protein
VVAPINLKQLGRRFDFIYVKFTIRQIYFTFCEYQIINAFYFDRYYWLRLDSLS